MQRTNHIGRADYGAPKFQLRKITWTGRAHILTYLFTELSPS
jgi:hypothetical protein